jgi:hypothetical protein
MFSSSLHCRQGYRWGKTNAPQVLGAKVPSFKNYPHRASEVLVMYREFWRLVMMHTPDEQPDLAVKLRNEFRKGRLIRGFRAVDRAVQRAEEQLNFWRGLVDTKTDRYEGKCTALLRPSAHMDVLKRSSTMAEGKSNQKQQQQQRKKSFVVQANSVDGVWQALQNRAEGSVPNLPNSRRSKKYSRSNVQIGAWYQ